MTDIVGGKITVRTLKRIIPLPYGVFGLGGSALTSSGQGSESGIATRVGGGLEIPLNGLVSLRGDYSRISSHLFSQWQTSRHFSVPELLLDC